MTGPCNFKSKHLNLFLLFALASLWFEFAFFFPVPVCDYQSIFKRSESCSCNIFSKVLFLFAYIAESAIDELQLLHLQSDMPPPP